MGRRVNRVRILLLAGFVAGSAGAGCTLEHRPDIQPDEAALEAADPATPRASAEDSARAVVSAFREALALGDGARVAALTAPDALLVDQEEGVRWRHAAEPAGVLPSPLVPGGDGLAWTVTSSEYARLGEAGLLVTRYTAEVAGEEVPWTAVESVVVVRTEEGWRVRYLHRSRGPSDGGGP